MWVVGLTASLPNLSLEIFKKKRLIADRMMSGLRSHMEPGGGCRVVVVLIVVDVASVEHVPTAIIEMIGAGWGRWEVLAGGGGPRQNGRGDVHGTVAL